MKRVVLLILSIAIAVIAFGQCYPDRHSTNWTDSWLSCERTQNPVQEWGNTHWIMYDLGELRSVKETHFWNFNDPQHLERGFKTVYISTSTTGQSWENSEPLYFPQADGFNDYEGFEGPTLNKNARYILLTAKTTHGDEQCGGLSEVRFALDEPLEQQEENTEDCLSIMVSPNPFESSAVLTFDIDCTGPIRFRIVDALGSVVEVGALPGEPGQLSYQLDWVHPSGVYFLQAKQGETYVNVQLVAQ